MPLRWRSRALLILTLARRAMANRPSAKLRERLMIPFAEFLAAAPILFVVGRGIRYLREPFNPPQDPSSEPPMLPTGL